MSCVQSSADDIAVQIERACGIVSTPFAKTITGAPFVSSRSQMYLIYRSENSSSPHGDKIPAHVSKICTASQPAADLGIQIIDNRVGEHLQQLVCGGRLADR